METDIFHEFVTLATHGSFVSAARELNMSQPALSRHIAALERQLKHRLLFDTRPLSLTVAGEVVLRHSGKLIHDYHNMLVELENLPRSKDEHILIQDLLHANTLYIGIKEAVRAGSEVFGVFQLDYVNVDNLGLNARQLVERKKVDLSFETTVSLDEIPAYQAPKGLKAILIPEFHGELVMGIPRDSPLAAKDELRLRDFAHSRFILQMNLLSERFVRDFSALCEEEGFYPNINYVSAKNGLEFYSADPADGIHLLVAVDKEYKPLIADLVKKHVKIRTLKDRKRYGNAFALIREENNSPMLAFLVEQMEQRAEQFLAKRERGQEASA
ncbi:MAG: LysR family transcriptional regulator [Coriobacteriales bacterium]|nr:LysR family transcriptional regulator [Coriobacteriales bacterium]